MGFRGKLATAIALLTTLTLAAALASPWWFWERGNIHTKCFIDGTCRDDGYIFKNNGDQQWVYDVTTGLAVVSIVPWLWFLHSLWARRSKR